MRERGRPARSPRREYTQALTQLATLRGRRSIASSIAVMVMADDPRCAPTASRLLARLRGLFLQVADLSRLPG